MKRSLLFLVGAALVLATAAAGCARPAIVAAPSEAAPFATSAAHLTPTPKHTPTSTATRRPTATLVPTLTLRPLPTPTPEPDFSVLARHMVELVNRDREVAGLAPVEWDDTAGRAAQGHAEEMALDGYLSHWNLMGYGPEHRYAFAGGRDAVRENVYSYYQRYSNGKGVPIQDWYGAVERAHQTLMDSPAHRDNILQPSHTHVGIGIAFEPMRGELRVAQEFVDRYVVLEPLPEEVRQGDAVELAGRMLPGASTPLINLAYEPFPLPRTVEELNTTSTYESAASTYLALNPSMKGEQFAATIRFSTSDAPGLYHVRVWVSQGGEQVLAGNVILRFR